MFVAIQRNVADCFCDSTVV